MNTENNGDLLGALEAGRLVTLGGVKAFAGEEWVAHPKFAGVRLKTLVSWEESGQVLQALLVGVDAGCELATHVHAGEWELHEVVGGEGEASLGGDTVVYQPGVMALILNGVEHSVRAGTQGVTLLAKFFKARE